MGGGGKSNRIKDFFLSTLFSNYKKTINRNFFFCFLFCFYRIESFVTPRVTSEMILFSVLLIIDNGH